MSSGACLSAMSCLHHQRLQTRRNEQERAGWKAANSDGRAAQALGHSLRAPGLKKLAGLGALSGLSTRRVLSAFPPAPPPLRSPRPTRPPATQRAPVAVEGAGARARALARQGGWRGPH